VNPEGVPKDAIPIGSGTFMVKVFKDGAWVGIIEFHNHNGEYDGGYVAFDVAGNETYQKDKWQVISLEPLTITPSVACHTCTHHGYITEGVWKDYRWRLEGLLTA
jgi:hypothetical protein